MVCVDVCLKSRQRDRQKCLMISVVRSQLPLDNRFDFSPFTFHLGFVHLLQVVALHQCRLNLLLGKKHLFIDCMCELIKHSMHRLCGGTGIL